MSVIADGAAHSLAYVLEVVYGTTPATPSFKYLSHNGTTLGLSKDPLESEKLRSDRNREDFRHGNRNAGGDIPAELEFGTFDDMLEALMCDTWTTDILKIGKVRRSFTFERHFSDLETPEYHRTRGGEVNSLSISVAPNKMVETTLGIVGKDVDNPATTIITGATYGDETTSVKPFDSFTGTIEEGGVTIGVVTQVDITLANGIEPRFVVGDNTTIRPSAQKAMVSGTLTAFYTNSTLYEKFLDETESSLKLVLTDPDGNNLEFKVSRLKYTTGKPDVSGSGSVTVPMEFVGLYDDTDGTSLMITRS